MKKTEFERRVFLVGKKDKSTSISFTKDMWTALETYRDKKKIKSVSEIVARVMDGFLVQCYLDGDIAAPKHLKADLEALKLESEKYKPE